VGVENKISNDLILEECGVWRLREHTSFAYSDGSHAEKYLHSVFEKDIDLSSGSADLKAWIKDWPSEYHLSVKRAQLLSGFDFDSGLKVLEVGCGCGAITRYLSENFDDVVSVEGSPIRAKLARMRNKGCDNVSIVCAPFQKLEFTEKFDLIVCIGVLEYSALFIEEENPYDHVLSYFSDLLTASGRAIIAIENQFGLKYFASSREDHLKVMFEGIEGYPVFSDKVKTFGRNELEEKLSRHFKSIEFCYPYPDYKIPDAVFSEEFLEAGIAGEMVSKFSSRDYYGTAQRLFDESLTTLELAKNNLLTVFSNSFVVVAGKESGNESAFKQLGVMFSSGRRKPYRMKTRFFKEEGKFRVEKVRLHERSSQEDSRLKVNEVSCLWIDGYSLHTRILLTCLNRKREFGECFDLVKHWLEKVEALSTEGELPGGYIDCIWSNTFFEGDEIKFIDQEWEWGKSLSYKVIFIRSVFFFLLATDGMNKLPGYLKVSNTKRLIRRVANLFDLELSNADFDEFALQESEFQSLVYGKKQARERFMIHWYLNNRQSLMFVKSLQTLIDKGSLLAQSARRYIRLP